MFLQAEGQEDMGGLETLDCQAVKHIFNQSGCINLTQTLYRERGMTPNNFCMRGARPGNS